MLIWKSIGASVLISFGALGLLYTNYSILSMILFSFGLITICTLNLNLFTGKCGFIFKDKTLHLLDLIVILITNIIISYALGILYGIAYPEIRTIAAEKVSTWSLDFSYFLKSCCCGVIMYLVVKIFKKYKSVIGICFGIPLFIMCGFQHSIANATIMGAASLLSPAILLCVAGNWVGSLFISALDNS